jgi:preprotein translocase subunit SecF
MNYRRQMVIPIGLAVFCAIALTVQMSSGLNLDIDLKGGTQITGEFQGTVTDSALQSVLEPYGATVRTSAGAGMTTVFIGVDESVESSEILGSLSDAGYELKDYSVQTVGAALGSSFFQQAAIVMGFAFIFMAVTVFFIFRIPQPSFFVVLCGVLDILETLALSQILGIQLSLATFSALLLLLGYSVDSNILLTTRVFKTAEGDTPSKVRGAMKTGITMVGATIAAMIALFLIPTSSVISQIASVLLIGLVLDIVNTWALNAPLLSMYMERKGKA